MQTAANSNQGISLDNFEKLSFILSEIEGKNIENIINNDILPVIEEIANIDLNYNNGSTPGPNYSGTHIFGTGSSMDLNFNLADISGYVSKIFDGINTIESILSFVPELEELILELKDSFKSAINKASEFTSSSWEKEVLNKNSPNTTIGVKNIGDLALFDSTTSNVTINDVTKFIEDPNRIIVRGTSVTGDNNNTSLAEDLSKVINKFTEGINAAGDDIFKVHINNYMDVTLKKGYLTEDEVGFYIEKFDNFISEVSDIRMKFGVMENRLGFNINNIKVSDENLCEANSKIEDADMAKEMMKLTKDNILQQAATTILAQANSKPDEIKTLLG